MILELETTNDINLGEMSGKNIVIIHKNSYEILQRPQEMDEYSEDYLALQRDAQLIFDTIENNYAEHLI